VKERLDILLAKKGLVESRTKAQWLIKNGFVIVNEEPINKPSKRVNINEKILIKQKFPYVGRGGIKLAAAIEEFSIDPSEKVCLDLGASIGGFTDCLLQKGAKRVYAVDSAKDLLHPSLVCKKERVVLLEETDARKRFKLDELIDILVIDITFASLKEILPNSRYYLKDNGDIIVLVKPLFEREFKKKEIFKIIKNEKDLKKILVNLVKFALVNDIYPLNIMKSPLLGKGGSIEFFIHFKLNSKLLTEDSSKIMQLKINSLFRDNQ
jgi:23S rRNA (cytidine1920-2'-O)/16S rRNA (cytidine1409-2'-O)-methyltransferase